MKNLTLLSTLFAIACASNAQSQEQNSPLWFRTWADIKAYIQYKKNKQQDAPAADTKPWAQLLVTSSAKPKTGTGNAKLPDTNAEISIYHEGKKVPGSIRPILFSGELIALANGTLFESKHFKAEKTASEYFQDSDHLRVVKPAVHPDKKVSTIIEWNPERCLMNTTSTKATVECDNNALYSIYSDAIEQIKQNQTTETENA